MGESGALIVFDHHFLAVAISDHNSPESEALETLVIHCPNRLIIGDSQGRLRSIYEELLGRERFALIAAELRARVSPENKLVARRRRWPVDDIPHRQVRYWKLFSAALAVRPTCIVTRIDAWKDHAENFESEYNTRILYADEFTNSLG